MGPPRCQCVLHEEAPSPMPFPSSDMPHWDDAAGPRSSNDTLAAEEESSHRRAGADCFSRAVAAQRLVVLPPWER